MIIIKIQKKLMKSKTGDFIDSFKVFFGDTMNDSAAELFAIEGIVGVSNFIMNAIKIAGMVVLGTVSSGVALVGLFASAGTGSAVTMTALEAFGSISRTDDSKLNENQKLVKKDQLELSKFADLYTSLIRSIAWGLVKMIKLLFKLSYLCIKMVPALTKFIYQKISGFTEGALDWVFGDKLSREFKSTVGKVVGAITSVLFWAGVVYYVLIPAFKWVIAIFLHYINLMLNSQIAMSFYGLFNQLAAMETAVTGTAVLGSIGLTGATIKGKLLEAETGMKYG